jgi:hypothetical protein
LTLAKPTTLSSTFSQARCRAGPIALALDIVKMEPLWAHDANVMLINPPDKGISIGWDAVKENWQAAFDAISEIKVTQAEGPHIVVDGNVAVGASRTSSVN